MRIAYILSLLGLSHGLFFNGGGGCGCRPQQCSCASAVPRNYCPPTPCGRPFQPYHQPYSPVGYRSPQATFIQQPYYAVPQPQTQFQYNSYQARPVPIGSNNIPFETAPSYISYPQNAPIQVTSAKETTADSFDSVIQKSKAEKPTEKNDLDIDNALSNFENSLQVYKSMNGANGIRRTQRSKTEKPETCSSARLQEIMQEAMTSNVSVSKLKISQGARKEFGYGFDVICSQYDFSYLISSNIFCRVELDGQICLAYEK